jgi:alpha-ketoglutarate-dependent taurine dioxygenase
VIEAEPGDDLPSWLLINRPTVDRRMREHGAVLFRGFGLGEHKSFQEAQNALCETVICGYGDLPEEKGTRQVYGSTPYPANREILFHNESSHLSDWPTRQFFACVIPAEMGGETPIVDCREVIRRLDPNLVEALERRGLLYVRTFIEGLDVSWRDFYKTEDRAAVERICEASGDECSWEADGTLQVRRRAQAVAAHPFTGERVFFNQIQLHEPHFLAASVREALLLVYGPDKLPRNVLYGDGEPIEPEALDHILQVYRRLAVAFPWRSGDMLMLDNMLMAHGRNRFKGARKIIVGLGDPFSRVRQGATQLADGGALGPA